MPSAKDDPRPCKGDLYVPNQYASLEGLCSGCARSDYEGDDKCLGEDGWYWAGLAVLQVLDGERE